MTTLSTAEAAKILEVSGATVRNWARAGHLKPVAARPISFNREDVMRLKERIRTNRFNRLRRRANKSASTEYDSPEIQDAKILGELEHVIHYIHDKKLDVEKALYTAALYVLEREGEAKLPHGDETFDFEAIEWKRSGVRQVMRGWLDRVGGPPRAADNPTILELFLGWNGSDDRVGLLYQGLSSVGKKSKIGAYFTPGEIIDASLSDMEKRPESFLDPCCGTGRYLVRAAVLFQVEPSRLYGFDTDPASVDIARLNVLLAYRERDFTPNVYCLDSLRELANGHPACETNALIESVDAIATNPPWGGCKNQARYKDMVALIKSGESFSLFLEKSLRLLRPGGVLSFLLPEAMLKIKTHTDLRKLLLHETSIRKISMLGRVFSGVFTNVIRLDLIKDKAHEDWHVAVEWDGEAHRVRQKRFVENVNHAFDVTVNANDAQLLDKIYSVRHVTLKGNADWALGVVTGDNRRLILSEPRHGSEPILRGRDLLKFAFREPASHIMFQPDAFQQVAPLRYYRAPEKLVYRFISERLIFAYDNQGFLTLNSANIVIPRLPDYSVKAAMAFLNSKVFQFIFTKRFHTRKVLRSDLEALPFPILTAPVLRELEGRVERCMGGEYQPAEELDILVARIFGLTRSEYNTIEANTEEEFKRILT